MKIPFFNIELRKIKKDIVELNKEVYNHLVNTDSKFPDSRPFLDPKGQVGDDQILMPITPIPLDVLQDVARYSDVLRTIHQNLRKEIFREGYEVIENFASKCVKCDKEFPNPKDICDECGSTDLREPDVEQKKILVKILKNVNDNKQNIIKVYEEINDDLETFDDAYLLCIQDYYYTGDGRLVQSVPVEFIRADPKFMRLIADKQGRPGRNQNGDYLFVCPDHRDQLQMNLTNCKMCGKELLRAHYRSENLGGKYTYYAENEVCHHSKYNPSLTYGFSVIYSIWMKVVTLMNMDAYMKAYYSKQRPPKGLLFVNTPNTDSLTKAWNWMLDQWKKNPHQIPPIAVEQTSGSKGNLVTFVDMMKGLDEMQYIETRNEMRRQVGAVYGVMPLFQGDVASSGGLNNEGLQITVTNRAVSDGQGLYNEDFNPWVCERLGVTDYTFVLNVNEEQDEVKEQELLSKKIANASAMQAMGFDVTFNEEGDFEFEPVDEPVEKPDQGMQGLFGGAPGASPEQEPGEVNDDDVGDLGPAPEIGGFDEPESPSYEGAPEETKFGKGIVKVRKSKKKGR